MSPVSEVSATRRPGAKSSCFATPGSVESTLPTATYSQLTIASQQAKYAHTSHAWTLCIYNTLICRCDSSHGLIPSIILVPRHGYDLVTSQSPTGAALIHDHRLIIVHLPTHPTFALARRGEHLGLLRISQMSYTKSLMRTFLRYCSEIPKRSPEAASSACSHVVKVLYSAS